MNKDRIFLYKVDRETAEYVSSRYGNIYEIQNVSDCFMDMMALRAKAVIIDPTELYDQEVELLTDVFRGEDEEEVYFTRKPSYPELLENVRWKLLSCAQKKEEKPMAAKKYSNNEIKSMLDTLENKLLSPETLDLGSFYRSGILNYKGKSREGDFYTELVSQWLLSKTDKELEKLLLAKADIKEEKEWPAEPIHRVENIDFSIGSNRDEENIAKQMMLQGKIGEYLIEDYQVPVNRASGSCNGKVDLILSNRDTTLLGELKAADSGESLLRAIVEIKTYQTKITENEDIRYRFTACYGHSKFEPAVIIFKGSRPYTDYCSDEMPKVKELANRFGIRVIEISPVVKGCDNIKDTKFLLSPC